jgi:hypothetical protein
MAYDDETPQAGAAPAPEGMAAPGDDAVAPPPAGPTGPEQTAEATGPPPPEGQQTSDSGESSLFLTPDMLPSGMKVNAGDILEFKVVNPSDADGHIEVVYNTGGGEEKGESWEDDFRHEMSARTAQTQAE